MEIRKAKSSDAKEIIEVNVKTWLTTYSGIMPEQALKNKVDNMEESIKKCEKTVEDDDNVLVAIKDGKIVGVVSYGKSRFTNDNENAGEIYSLYVLKEYQRQGIGKKLFFVAKNILNRQGYKNIIVTCIVENPANEFYKKIGGKKKETIKSNIYGIQMYENLIKFDN